MDVSGKGGKGTIIFAFGLWGSGQLIDALVKIIVVLCYRSLVPYMYVLLILETLLRMLVPRIKSVSFSHTPPGAIGNYILLLLSALMLGLCYRGRKNA